MKTLINAEIYTGERVIKEGYIQFDEKIRNLGSMAAYEKTDETEVIDLKGKILVPGFIDVHSHGGYGADTMDAEPDKISEMTYKMLAEGITSYFPTTMTQSDEKIEQAMLAVKEAKKINPMIQGIHLEGPFVSPAHKGAQPEEFMGVANVEKMKKWNDLSGGNIRLVTYAPELGDVSAFEQYCLANDIILSAGHTGATYAQLKKSKASHITHLFNGQLGLHHREIGTAGFALLEDFVYAEMIVDGYHIDPNMVKLVYKMKDINHILLITDSMRAKGISEGESELGGQKVIVKNKQARLENGALAGSVLTFDDAFRNMIKFTGCEIEQAVKMSSVNQAREFNLLGKGNLEKNSDADIVVFNQDLVVEKTILGGTIHDFK